MKLIIEKIVQETHDLVSTSASSWTVGMQIDHMLAHAAAGDERVLSISLSIEDEEWAAIREIVHDNASVAAGFDKAADRAFAKSDHDKAADKLINAIMDPTMAAPAHLPTFERGEMALRKGRRTLKPVK